MNSTSAAIGAMRRSKKMYPVAQTRFDGGERRIAEGDAASFDVRAGAAIRCVAGKLWLTQEGDVRDYVVPAGTTFCTDRSGRVVVSAIDGASAVPVFERAPAHCVPGSVAIDSIERFTDAARKAQGQYVAALFSKAIGWIFRRRAHRDTSASRSIATVQRALRC
jgi:hypothetical protein